MVDDHKYDMTLMQIPCEACDGLGLHINDTIPTKTLCSHCLSTGFKLVNKAMYMKNNPDEDKD